MKRDTDSFQYQIESEQPLYRGFYHMDQLTVAHQRFQGGMMTIKRELLDRHDAVCVLPVDLAREQVILIEQFRIGALREDNPWLLELVAGLIDKDEQPQEVAHREALEEANISLGRMRPITRYLPSAGGTNERIHLFIAEADSTKASGVHGLDDEGEDILVHTVSFEDAFQLVRDGTINNAAAIIALQWLQLNLADLKSEWL